MGRIENSTLPAKGHLISKAIYGLLTSSKKQTDEFVLFAFLLFTANKSNLFIFWENLRLANLLFDFTYSLAEPKSSFIINTTKHFNFKHCA